MDRLTAMRSFIEVAKSGSFTKAATTLAISRLQVSRHVLEVESWLKQRLLHRTTRSVSLTTTGEEMLRHCEKILNETAEMEVRSQQKMGLLKGNIRVASPIGLAQNILFDVIDQFLQQHPQTNIEVLVSDSFAQLVEERVDIALRFTTEPNENLIARRLRSIDSVLCASQGYLEQFQSPSNPQQLSQHNCLIHGSRNQWDFVKNDSHFSVTVKGNLRANDLGVLIRAAVIGRGIIKLPCDLANPLLASNQLQAIMLDYRIPLNSLWAVYLSRSYQLPLVRQFIDFLAQSWSQDIVLLADKSRHEKAT
jgi:DNA-binding transcriptional LysR family regulator